MKKIFSLLLILPFAAMFTGCSDDDLIFDHERAQFEIRENAILLEVIMPTTSSVDDTYYIIGEFNGGMDEAIGDPTWQLQKAEGNDSKWGIYLLPETFVDGKDLSDGYYFYSMTQGAERSNSNQAVMHVLENARVGTRTNIWVDRWEFSFSGGGDDNKDFYTIYVDDQSGNGISHLYVYNTGLDDTPGWPGYEMTGTTEIDGINFIYFEMPAELRGLSMNIILNNDSGWQTEEPSYTLNQDLYFRVNLDKTITLLDPDDLVPAYSGYTVYVDDQADFTITHMYAYGVGQTTPSFPGWETSGTADVNGTTYTYFRPGMEYNGATLNVVFSDGTTANQTNAPEILLDEDVYIRVTGTTAVVIDPNEIVQVSRTIRVEDTAGWGAMALHYWGTGITGTNWPGLQPDGTETIGTRTYYVFEMPEELDGKNVDILFNNNNGGIQTADGFSLVLDKDYYLTLSDNGGSKLEPEEIIFRIYVTNDTNLNDLAIYAWGDMEAFGEWPGAVFNDMETVNGVTYYYVEIPSDATDKGLNLIINWDSGGSSRAQYDLAGITVNRDYYYEITGDGGTEVNP